MSMLATAIQVGERLPLPDFVTRAAITRLVGSTRAKLAAADAEAERRFAEAMVEFPIAEQVEAANRQHYEVPAAFFGLVLGPRRKYSCCLYPRGDETLAEAEAAALAETAAHAGLVDGQRILELGCGWGSLTLWLAEQLPNARITSVSNSHSQRTFILAEAKARDLRNVEVVTCDMNDFAPTGRFDRIVSVEMFEHMSSWRRLLERARCWLELDGRLFLHVFAHRRTPYRFDRADPTDWIAQHFFTGGIMPSHQLIRNFPDLFEVEAEWRWNGRHYARTAEQWLANLDAELPAVQTVLAQTYGGEAGLWQRRWRLFFLATAGLFGHAGGDEWGVSHYLLRPARATAGAKPG